MKYGNLNILDTAKYDVMALGGLVVREDPGKVPYEDAMFVDLHVSGAEYNPMANTSSYGLKGAIVTGMGDYCKGRKIRKILGGLGIDILGKTFPHTPWSGTHATVFSGRPGGHAINEVDYDRAGEAAAMLKPGMLDYDNEIFKDGAKWVHSGGLYAALAPHIPDLIIEFFQEAKKRGAIVSSDLNYREKLWKHHGGQQRAIEAMTEIVKYVDVLFGNETDMKNSLGIISPVEGKSPIDPEPFKVAQKMAKEKFPNLEVIATSLRDEYSNIEHMWGAVAYIGGKTCEVPAKKIAVEDRIGGGDGFAGGLITAIQKGLPPQEALDAAWASGVLVASYPGDITRAPWEHVGKLAKSAREKETQKVER